MASKQASDCNQHIKIASVQLAKVLWCFGNDQLACRQTMADILASSTIVSMSAGLLGQEPTMISGVIVFQFNDQRL